MSKCIIYHHRTRASGAEGVHIRGIMDAFSNLGYAVYDISIYKLGVENARKQGSATTLFKYLNYLVAKLPNILFKMFEVLYSLYAFFITMKTISKCKINYIGIDFVYERYSYFNIGTAIAAKMQNVPFVLEVNTTCLDYDVRNIMFRPLARRAEQYLFDTSALIIVVSNYLKNRIMSEYNIESSKIVVTPNAVDPRYFNLENTGNKESQLLQQAIAFAANRTIIGFVGVFVPWHGLDFLVDVFVQSRKELAECSVGLLLVGDGPVRGDIEKKIKDLGIASDVLITGIVPHHEIKNYIELFDVAIMPDSNPFGSPMKIFEYMIMGKPVVAPNYGPICDVIQDGHNGLIFSAKDIVSCMCQITRLIIDVELGNRIGNTARDHVLLGHTWTNNVTTIINAFKRV